MGIRFQNAFGISEKGPRSVNEDSVYPQLIGYLPQKESRFYMVCDGVGGKVKGDIASKFVCESFGEFFKTHDNIDKEQIEKALKLSEDYISDYLLLNPFSEGMATTLSFVYCNNDGVFIAHIGDTRIYHIRGNQILYCTKNHSIMEEMIADGIITEEQSKTHPNRHAITRAISGAEKPTIADILFIDNVMQGDYFFLCSDGVWEEIDLNIINRFLCNPKIKDLQKIKNIQTHCQSRTHDNFSAYLVPVVSYK